MNPIHVSFKVMDDGVRPPEGSNPSPLHEHFKNTVKRIATVGLIYGVNGAYEAATHTIHASGSVTGLFRFCNELGLAKITVSASINRENF